MKNNNLSKNRLFYYLFYFLAMIFVSASIFFILFLNVFRLYSTEANFLVVAKDSRTTLNRNEIVNNIALIAQTLNFYERVLSFDNKIADEVSGLSKTEKRNYWNDALVVNVVDDSHILKLDFQNKDYQQSRLMAYGAVKNLNQIVSAFYNNQIEVKLIDSINTSLVVSSWVKLLGICFGIALIISLIIFSALNYFRIINLSFREKRVYSKFSRRADLNVSRGNSKPVNSYSKTLKENISASYKEKKQEERILKIDTLKQNIVFDKSEKILPPKYIAPKYLDSKEIKEEEEIKFLGREALKMKLKEAVQSGVKLEKMTLVKKNKPDRKKIKKIEDRIEEKKDINKKESQIKVSEINQENEINLRKKPQLPSLDNIEKSIGISQKNQITSNEDESNVKQFGRIALQYKDWKFGDVPQKVENISNVAKTENKKNVAPVNLPGNLPGGDLPDYMRLSLQPKGNHIDERVEGLTTITKSLMSKSEPTGNLPVGLVGANNVPSNLSIGSGTSFPYETKEINERNSISQSVPGVKLVKEKKEEPSESEYKERLNQLLKGEL